MDCSDTYRSAVPLGGSKYDNLQENKHIPSWSHYGICNTTPASSAREQLEAAATRSGLDRLRGAGPTDFAFDACALVEGGGTSASMSAPPLGVVG